MSKFVDKDQEAVSRRLLCERDQNAERSATCSHRQKSNFFPYFLSSRKFLSRMQGVSVDKLVPCLLIFTVKTFSQGLDVLLKCLLMPYPHSHSSFLNEGLVRVLRERLRQDFHMVAEDLVKNKMLFVAIIQAVYEQSRFSFFRFFIADNDVLTVLPTILWLPQIKSMQKSELYIHKCNRRKECSCFHVTEMTIVIQYCRLYHVS